MTALILPPVAGDGRGARIAGVAALSLGRAAAGGAAAFATRDVFAALHGAGGPAVAALAVIAAAGLVAAVLRIGERALAERVGCDYAAAARETLFLALAATPPSALDRRSTGGLSLRFVADLGSLRGWVGRGLGATVSAAVVIPVTLGVIIALDWRLAAAATPPLLLAGASIAASGGRIEAAHRRARRARSRLAAVAAERALLGPALRLVDRVDAERRRLRSRSAAVSTAVVGAARRVEATRAAPDAAAGLAAALILAAAAHVGAAPATAAAALAALGLCVAPLRALADAQDRWRRWRLARRRLAAALAGASAPLLRSGRARPTSGAPALKLDAVDVGRGGVWTRTIHAGDAVSLPAVGAEATALIRVIAGLEPALGGRVRVFGRTPHRGRPAGVAVIGPQAPILRGSLRRNATLGMKRRPDDGAISEALVRCGAGGLLERAGGLDARVSEAGRTLSAQEAAALLCARALLGRAKLILVDGAAATPPPALQALRAAARDDGTAVLVLGGGPLAQTPIFPESRGAA